MSGKKFILIMFLGVLATAAFMYTLYFFTRQLDYVPPDEGAVSAPISVDASAFAGPDGIRLITAPA